MKKNFTSQRSNHTFIANTILQFESSDTNVYDCIEICQFAVWETGEKKVWHFTDLDDWEKMKGWEEFLEPVERESVVKS